LVLIGSTLQVVHSHPDNLSHADCALCATAHVVVHVVAIQTLPEVTLSMGIVQRFVSLPAAQAPTIFALFTRPPPPSWTLA
jgi:hypothetical protein